MKCAGQVDLLAKFDFGVILWKLNVSYIQYDVQLYNKLSQYRIIIIIIFMTNRYILNMIFDTSIIVRKYYSQNLSNIYYVFMYKFKVII